MIVRKIIYEGQKPTPEQTARLNALKAMDDNEIICDAECPELTDEELGKMRRVIERRPLTA